jgi:broad-specificity NMP kinase
MIRIMITGSVPGIGKTALICRLLKVFSGYAVIQVNEKGGFTSINSEAEGEEPNLLRDSGAIQVIHIQTDPKDVTDAMDQALCLLPLQTEGIIIEGNLSPNNFQADIVIFLTDSPLNNLDPILEEVNIVVVKCKIKENLTGKDSIRVPVFVLDTKNMDEEEWKRFLAYLMELLDSLKAQGLGY